MRQKMMGLVDIKNLNVISMTGEEVTRDTLFCTATVVKDLCTRSMIKGIITGTIATTVGIVGALMLDSMINDKKKND